MMRGMQMETSRYIVDLVHGGPIKRGQLTFLLVMSARIYKIK